MPFNNGFTHEDHRLQSSSRRNEHFFNSKISFDEKHEKVFNSLLVFLSLQLTTLKSFAWRFARTAMH